MAKTRDQMVTIVADAIGKSRSASSISGAVLEDRCIDFINWGQQAIARKYDFQELSTSTTYSLASSAYVIAISASLGIPGYKDISAVVVRKTTGGTDFLARLPLPRMLRVYKDILNFTQGTAPRHFVVWGGNLLVGPPASTTNTIEVFYTKYPIDLTTAAATSMFIGKDDLIVTAAIVEGYSHFSESELTKQWKELFNAKLEEAVSAEKAQFIAVGGDMKDINLNLIGGEFDVSNKTTNS